MNFEVIENKLTELSDVIKEIGAELYQQKISVISNATIGQHCRHIIELFEILLSGYNAGIIDYENRTRNLLIETDLNEALGRIDEIITRINKPDKNLLIDVVHCSEAPILSTYYRELVYNFEHLIHHAAIINIAIKSLGKNTEVADFGIAPSTINYRKKCAQ